MWIAERNSTKASTDEDRAMAQENYGQFDNKELARRRLLEAVQEELKYHINRNVAYVNTYCIIRLAGILEELQDHVTDSAEVDGLRFRIREVNLT